MTQQAELRRFGPPPRAPGVEVIERSGTNALADPRYGTVAFFGVLKRGPMGVPIPVDSRNQYDTIFGDPRDSRWHLYRDGSHQLPDAVDGFFATGGGNGRIWMTRLDLDGKARKAELILKGRNGAEVLKIVAANEGRWGGYRNHVAVTPIVVATTRTFTLVAPGVEANEFVGAEAVFSGVANKTYAIVANTATHPSNNEVIFTVGAQYDLIADGVAGPVGLTGTAAYSRYTTLTGTIAFPLYEDLVGTLSLSGIVVTGTGTSFSDLTVGQNLYINGEARAIQSITSDTTLTVAAPFTATGGGLTGQINNLTVTGTTTEFEAELSVGDTLYVTVGGQLQGRTVAEIASDTSLTLESGFTEAKTAGTQAQTDNLTVVGTETAFTTELTAGSILIDPNRQGATVTVAAIASDTSLTLQAPFGSSFTAAQVSKQTQSAQVDLVPSGAEGLSVLIGQGTRYPATHFSMDIRFNGSLVGQWADVSLDPEDPQGLFVEPLINDSNVAYRTGSSNYQTWITAESLWNSAYTTAAGSDVRPANGSGKTLEATAQRLYTVSALMDYAAAIGNLLYPDPYTEARNYFRIKAAAAPLTLAGTVSSSGTTVTGTNTTFLSQLSPGDRFYDPNTDTVRTVKAINSNTQLILESAFATNIPALTVARRAGYIGVDQGYDLAAVASVGTTFLAAYPNFLEKGYDGNTATLLPFHFTKFADIDRNYLEQAVWGRNQGLVRIACPGISDVAIQRAFTAYAGAKAFEYRMEIPSTYTSSAAAESFVVQTLGRDDFASVAFPSYGFIANPLGAGDRLVSLSGDIMGGESMQAVAHQGYHQPFAGVNAILPRFIKLPLDLLPSDEAILNVSGIQPIKLVDGKFVVFGGRAPARSPMYDFLHIRRIQSNFVRIFLEARTLLEMLFRPNQPDLAEQIIMIMENFARREYRKGVFTQYLNFEQAVQVQPAITNADVVTDTDTADAIVEIINGRLRIFFRYVPTGILETVSIDCGPDILVAQYGNTVSAV